MAWRWNRVITVSLAVFAVAFVVIFVLASWYVRERERSCAESCHLKGFAGYEYKGFSGGVSGRWTASLRSDSCTCTSAAGSSASPAK